MKAGTWRSLSRPHCKGSTASPTAARIESEASGESDAEAIRELLVDQMRDFLHAEKQLLKGLPKMAKAASHKTLARAL